MGFLPVCVDLTARKCLVIGGGAVAERKVASLLELGARVKVVSPRLTARLQSWVGNRRIRYEERAYETGDVTGQQIVFVATNDGAINHAVATEAHEHGIWVNASDDPKNCDFILPSILRRGPVTVAVSTGGASPALARLIREQLAERVTEEYAVMAELASEVRRELREQSKSPTAEAWRGALEGEFRTLAAQGDRTGAKAHLLDRLGRHNE